MHVIFCIMFICIENYICIYNAQYTYCYVHPRFETLDGNAVLQLDPAIPGVFNGPYPLGIDPVKTFTLITAETKYAGHTPERNEKFVYSQTNKKVWSWQDI